jgi:hypothetical protein
MQAVQQEASADALNEQPETLMEVSGAQYTAAVLYIDTC